MDEREREKKGEPTVMVVERRRQGNRDLSAAEVMRIVRNRSAKRLKGESKDVVDGEEES